MVEKKTQTPKKTVTGLPVNTEAALCYLGFWVTGLIFLLVEKDNKLIRFHALQSLVTFAPLMMLTMFPVIGRVLAPFVWLGIFIIWLVCIVKAFQGEKFKLPLVGEFVEKQLK